MKACLSRLISYLGKPGSLRGTLKAMSPSVYCVNLGTLFCAQLWHIMKEYGETVFIWSPWLPPHPTHPSILLSFKPEGHWSNDKNVSDSWILLVSPKNILRHLYRRYYLPIQRTSRIQKQETPCQVELALGCFYPDFSFFLSCSPCPTPVELTEEGQGQII